MTLVYVSARNILRNRLRTALTVLGVGVTVLAFIVLRTVIGAWNTAVDYAAKDRIGTRNKVTFVMPLPKNYIDAVRQVPGVKAATFANWFGAKDPRHETEFFGNMAVETKTFFDVYDEMVVPPAQKEQWLADRRGAIVGDVLARKLGWKVGDRITLTGTIYPGDWQFQIDGLYTATRRSVDRSSFFFHWDYLNDSVAAARQKDRIGWIISRIDDPRDTTRVSAAIDKLFDERDTQTLSMSERAMNVSFMGMVSAVLQALDVVSIVILAIMMLILGNTIAMGARERTGEYGVLRAMGFLPRHIMIFIFGEAATVGLLGGALGALLSYPLIERGMGRFVEENLGSFFPYFRVSPVTAGTAVLLAMGLSFAAALVPAYRASRLDVVSALRRVA